MFVPEDYRKQIKQLFAELQTRIKGPLEYHKLMVSGIITLANILIESDQGKAKSKYATDAGTAFGCEAHRVQGMPGLSMDEVLAMFDLGKLQQGTVEIVWREKFLKSAFKFIDELNRIPAPLLSALFPPLAGEDSFYKGSMFPASQYPATWIATINKRDSANNELPKPFLDRFDICLVAPSPELWDCFDILFDKDSDVYKKMPKLSTEENLREGAKHIAQIPFSKGAQALIMTMQRGFSYCELGEKEDLKNFPACCKDCTLAQGAAICKELRAGLSMRTGLAAKKLAGGLAFLEGKEMVDETDVLTVLPAVLRHRVTYAAPSAEHTNKMDLANLVDKVSKAAKDVADIMAKTTLTTAEIRNYKQSTNPLVKELAKRLRPAAISIKPLEQHSAEELQKRLDADNFSAEELPRAKAMLEAIKTVTVTCGSVEIYEPEFQELFTSEDGEQFLTADEWVDFLDEERFTCTTFNFEMLKFNTPGGDVVIKLKFAQATAGDACRKALVSNGLDATTATWEETDAAATQAA